MSEQQPPKFKGAIPLKDFIERFKDRLTPKGIEVLMKLKERGKIW